LAAADCAAFGTDVCLRAGFRARVRAARFGAADLRLAGRFLAERFVDPFADRF